MNSKVVNPLEWNEGKLKLIDQRYIPLREEYVTVSNISECHEAIRVMVVRGAPLIGFTAIWGMVLWLRNHPGGSLDEFIKAGEFLITARPTAVNLEFEVHRSINMATKWSEENGSLEGFVSELENLGNAQYEELEKKNLTMAKLASEELTGLYGSRKLRLMTLCNTGRLACGPLGTALGVISYMASNGRVEIAYPSETRPYLQGSRLTAYEMLKEGIPHKIVVEGAASWLMREGKIDAIFIGADRIASNGDTANKIGSSSLAIIAKHYGVPFYVVAPLSSFDLNIESGKEIEIELRPEDEILSLRGQPVAPDGSHALNPSFDITTNDLITGIFCEKGIVKPVNRRTSLKLPKAKMKRASIDIGSNSTLLLIADLRDSDLVEYANETRVTSLGKDLDKTGVFSSESMRDTYQALTDYKNILAKHNLSPEEVVVTATEASRVAKNSIEFYEQIKKELGFSVRIISSDEEAYYVALGVCKASPSLSRDQFIIMDVGGASTEFIYVKVDPFEVSSVISLPFGSVRGADWIKEGCFDERMNKILADPRLDNFKADYLMCVAGSMTSLGGMVKGLKKFDGSAINGSAITLDVFRKFVTKILDLKPRELLSNFPFLGKRSKSIVAGARIGLLVGERLGIKTFEISTLGLRYGTLLEGADSGSKNK